MNFHDFSVLVNSNLTTWCETRHIRESNLMALPTSHYIIQIYGILVVPAFNSHGVQRSITSRIVLRRLNRQWRPTRSSLTTFRTCNKNRVTGIETFWWTDSSLATSWFLMLGVRTEIESAYVICSPTSFQSLSTSTWLIRYKTARAGWQIESELEKLKKKEKEKEKWLVGLSILKEDCTTEIVGANKKTWTQARTHAHFWVVVGVCDPDTGN